MIHDRSPGDEPAGPPSSWPMTVGSSAATTRAQRIFAEWIMDILTYVVVLNLFVEYIESVVIDSFTISILTALLLKVLLVVILTGKKAVWGWAKEKGSGAYRVLGALGVWAILFLSKFLILKAEDFFFGDRVELGGLVAVMALTAGLTVARESIQHLYLLLGRPRSPAVAIH